MMSWLCRMEPERGIFMHRQIRRASRWPAVPAALVIIVCFAASHVRGQELEPPAGSVDISIVPRYREIIARVSADSVLASLRTLESLGVKAAGTPALSETADWLQARFEAYGYTDITRQDFSFGSHRLQNLIVTRAGTSAPDRFLIIDGHYDTIRGPGVNDNGSGVAVILEAARVLADVDCAISIRFINFAAEEVGLVGSRAYVNEIAVPRAMDIVLVLNIDEVGGVAGLANTTVTCERDEGPPVENNAASAACTDTLAALTRAYSSLETHIAHAYGSDYMPFEDAGYVITGFYETNESRCPHTPNDLLVNMDPAYVAQIARATVAAALHFARADPGPPPR